MMLRYAGAKNGAFEVGGNQQLNRTGVTIGGGRFHHHSDRSIVIFGNPDLMLTFTERWRGDQIAALQQIVIIAVRRQNLIEQRFLLGRRLLSNRRFCQLIDGRG